MTLVRDATTRAGLVAIAAQQFGDMVKAVVGVERRLMAVEGNRSRGVEDAALRERIRAIVAALVPG